MDINKKSLELHRKFKGKLEIHSKVQVNNPTDMSLVYTPGVAEPCRKIHKNSENVYQYTNRGNLVAVVTDGSAVLGLGDIGPLAALPVMEGKSVLFKKFSNIDAFPICLNTKNVDEIVKTIELLAPSFGGINLEDISAPRCYEIENRLKQSLDIPVFHDDQHGTAIVATAALINALKLVNKTFETIKVVINGIGSAGSAIARLLLQMGVKSMFLCGRHGIMYPGDPRNDFMKEMLAQKTNPAGITGNLAQAMEGADVFIGVSVPHCVSQEMIASMDQNAIVLAMANPIPEIMPSDARNAGARIVGTGRSDFPNQVNNVLAFPGIFRGALSVRASDINQEMRIAAAYAIASVIPEKELKDEYIIPAPFDTRVALAVAEAVAQAAIQTGVAKL